MSHHCLTEQVDFPGHAQGLQGLSGNGLEFCLTDNSTFRFADLANDAAGQTIATVKGIFTELAALFPDSEELFIGADEVGKNGNCTMSDYAKIESSVCKFITSAGTDGLNRTVGGWEE